MSILRPLVEDLHERRAAAKLGGGQERIDGQHTADTLTARERLDLLVDGRHVAVCAYDFTVMAGSMGTTGEVKVTRLRELALTKRMPFVWLLDSAGAPVQEAVGSLFAGTGALFAEEVRASGVIPQVAALMGRVRRERPRSRVSQTSCRW